MGRLFTIPSKKEYKIDNDKVVDNQVRTIDYVEATPTSSETTANGSLLFLTHDTEKYKKESTVDFYVAPRSVRYTSKVSHADRKFYPCYIKINRAKSWKLWVQCDEIEVFNDPYIVLQKDGKPREVSSLDEFISAVEEFYDTTSDIFASYVCAYGRGAGDEVLIYFTILRQWNFGEYNDIIILTKFECKYNTVGQSSKTKLYSMDNKVVSDYSLETNELTSTDVGVATTSDEQSVITSPIGKLLCEKIASEYKNGRETATIKCSVGNFYGDEYENEKTIDIDNAETASVGDTVVPYVRTGRKGGWQYDAPLSSDGYGNAKSFDVIGVEHVFDGAIWQVLTLIESV